MNSEPNTAPSIPWFGARKLARSLLEEVGDLRVEVDRTRVERDGLQAQLARLGGLTIVQLEARRAELESAIAEQALRLEQERETAAAEVKTLKARLEEVRRLIVQTEDVALLQEAGVYVYRHPPLGRGSV